MRKRLCSFLTIIALLWGMIGVGSMSAYAGEINVIVNGEELEADQGAEIYENRAFLPLRAVSEEIGAKVEWTEKTHTATITLDDTEIETKINDKNMRVKKGSIVTVKKLGAFARIVNGRTMVPLRDVLEELGVKVDWDNNSRVASITGGKPKFIALKGTKGANPDENYKNLFDADAETKWCVVDTDNAYVIWKATVPVVAKGYAVVTSNDCESYIGSNPSNWTLYGCNTDYVPDREDSQWKVIDWHSEDNVLEDKNNTRYDYKLSNIPPEYCYFKLETDIAENSDCMQLSEFAVLYDGYDYNCEGADNGGNSSAKSGSALSVDFGKSSSGRNSSSDIGSDLNNDFDNSSSGSGSSGSFDIFSSSRGESTCTFCGGTGSRTCSVCGGDGQVEDIITTPNYSGKRGGGGTRRSTRRCPNVMCHGGSVDCTYCGGDGRR